MTVAPTHAAVEQHLLAAIAVLDEADEERPENGDPGDRIASTARENITRALSDLAYQTGRKPPDCRAPSTRAKAAQTRGRARA